MKTSSPMSIKSCFLEQMPRASQSVILDAPKFNTCRRIHRHRRDSRRHTWVLQFAGTNCFRNHMGVDKKADGSFSFTKSDTIHYGFPDAVY